MMARCAQCGPQAQAQPEPVRVIYRDKRTT